MLEIDLIAEAEKQFAPDIVEELRKHRRRAVHLQIARTAEQKAEALLGCYFGGLPTLPSNLSWPHYEELGYEFPMTFVGQFDCASLPRLEGCPIPEKGTLFFFFDFAFHYLRGQSSEEKKKEGGCVYFTSENCSTLPPVSRPPAVEAPLEGFASLFDEEAGADDYGACPTYQEFLNIVRAPALERQDIVPILTDSFQILPGLNKCNQQINELLNYRRERIVKQFSFEDNYVFRLFGEDQSDSRYSERMDIIPLLTFGTGQQFPSIGLVQYLIEYDALLIQNFREVFIGSSE